MLEAKIINPFLEAAANVLQTMAMIQATPGKPFIKKDGTAMGEVTGIIGITGDHTGSLSISFSKSCIASVVTNLFGTTVTEVNDEVCDAVGELTNMISGDARRRLEAQEVMLDGGTPTIVSGKGHSVTHIHDGPYLAVPFETPSGQFTVEIAFNKE